MTSEQVSLIRKQLYSLLQTIRKEAVPLVDAFDIPDEILNSVLGRYDGNVYTHLYEWALKAPRNKKQVRVQISLSSCAREIYSRASEQRTLWERASCPLLGGCPYLGGSIHFDCIILNKLVNALKCMIRAVEMIIKWLVCSVFSINIAQTEFFCF